MSDDYAERVLAKFERDTEYLAGHIADIKEKQAEYERRHDRFIEISRGYPLL